MADVVHPWAICLFYNISSHYPSVQSPVLVDRVNISNIRVVNFFSDLIVLKRVE